MSRETTANRDWDLARFIENMPTPEGMTPVPGAVWVGVPGQFGMVTPLPLFITVRTVVETVGSERSVFRAAAEWMWGTSE